MKVYQAFYSSASEGSCCYWGRTKTEARSLAHVAACGDDTVNEGMKLSDYQVVEHKIEVGADGLAAWLNVHFNRDNG